jgi:surface carbohydrate biosynthesis protein
MKRRWLILPIETKVRELDGRLLLAATAARRGWGVILGHKDVLAEDTAAIKGVVLEKDGHIANRRIAQYQQWGKLVCALDEEGLVYLNGEDYFRRRLSQGSLQRLALFCLWGENQKRDILTHVQGMESRLVLTGNPRFDMLRPGLREYYAAEAGQIRDRLGSFLLINTNFADSNHFMGTEWVIESYRGNGFITNRKQEADERRFIAYQAGIADCFLEMVRALSLRYPGHQIVVRPHPSENHERWWAAARKLKNVQVLHEGDVNPWLMAADAGIHNSCMTGIHGFLLERPTIAYMPTRSESFDYYLPNALSARVETLEGLFSAVDRVLGDGRPGQLTDREDQMSIARSYISAIDGPLASERIMDALESLPIGVDGYRVREGAHYGPTRQEPRGESRPEPIRETARKIGHWPRAALAAVRERKHRAYSRQKYPGMYLAEIEDKIAALQAAASGFDGLGVWRHGNQSFGIARLS